MLLNNEKARRLGGERGSEKPSVRSMKGRITDVV